MANVAAAIVNVLLDTCHHPGYSTACYDNVSINHLPSFQTSLMLLCMTYLLLIYFLSKADPNTDGIIPVPLV
jgi:hypothetical protein